jgi:hypothetical protein
LASGVRKLKLIAALLIDEAALKKKKKFLRQQAFLEMSVPEDEKVRNSDEKVRNSMK